LDNQGQDQETIQQETTVAVEHNLQAVKAAIVVILPAVLDLQDKAEHIKMPIIMAVEVEVAITVVDLDRM
jgi:hypothetical protein